MSGEKRETEREKPQARVRARVRVEKEKRPERERTWAVKREETEREKPQARVPETASGCAKQPSASTDILWFIPFALLRCFSLSFFKFIRTCLDTLSFGLPIVWNTFPAVVAYTFLNTSIVQRQTHHASETTNSPSKLWCCSAVFGADSTEHVACAACPCKQERKKKIINQKVKTKSQDTGRAL